MSSVTVFRSRVREQRRRLIAIALLTPLVAGAAVTGSAIGATAAEQSTTVSTEAELIAAFDAASGGGNTITLGADITSAGIAVPSGATVTLKLNDHLLTATGAPERAGIAVRLGSTLIVDGPGVLSATGGDSAAGIGSPVGDNTPAGDAGTVIINGGTINAQGGTLGAGIGSGGWSEGGAVTITGGDVTARGGSYGAGIGSGYNRAPGSITITGGSVIALGGDEAAGIGGGTQSGAGGTLLMSGGSVMAIGGGGTGGGAGLGGGYGGIAIDITTTGGSIIAAGGTGIAVDSQSLSNGGTITTLPGNSLTVSPGRLAQNTGTIINNGVVVVDGTFANSGTLSNAVDGGLPHALLVNGILHNTGTIDGDGAIEVAGALVSSGDLPAAFASAAAAFTLHDDEDPAGSTPVDVYTPSMQTASDVGLTLFSPTRVGHAFTGWSVAPGGGVLWDPATPLTADTALFAQWSLLHYTVTFDSGGGGAVAPISIGHGSAITAPAPPTRAGFDFIGWSTDAGGHTAWDQSVAVTESTTLFAQWRPMRHTVAFDSRGGSAVAAVTVEHGQTVPLPAAPTRTGFTFGGWASNMAATVTWNPGTAVTTTVTLYAMWEAVAVVVPEPTPTPITSPAPSQAPSPTSQNAAALANSGWDAAPFALGAMLLLGAGVLMARRLSAPVD